MNRRKCVKCNKIKPLSKFYLFSNNSVRHYRHTCKVCVIAQKIQYNQRIRREVLNAYGGKCVCCGESGIPFLTIDHKDGSGHEDRRNHGTNIYSRLKILGFPKGNFQVMCWNCNCAKWVYAECPHKTQRRTCE